MNNILDTAIAYNKLTQIEYEITLAKKNKVVSLHIIFQKNKFYHLAGLQYLTDIHELDDDRESVFNNIINLNITNKKIESSQYYSRIQERVDYLANLEQIFDSNDTIFKYDPNNNSITTSIKGEYLMQNNIQNRDVFVFLDKEKDGSYYCRSFFPKEFTDYSKGQSKWTVLSKKKIWKDKNIEIQLYDYQEEKNKKKEIQNALKKQYENLREDNILISIDEYNKLQETYKIVYQHCNITINGKHYECVNGLAKGFANLLDQRNQLIEKVQNITNNKTITPGTDSRCD